MGYNRHRVDQSPLVIGTRKVISNSSGAVLSSSNYAAAREFVNTIDDWNPGVDSPGDLYIEHERYVPVSWSRSGIAGQTIQITNRLLKPVISHLSPSECGAPFSVANPFTNVNQLATIAAARTNPSRPDVSIPQFIGELKDLPRAILDRGNKGLSWAKSSSLGVRFGILPMVSDVLKLMHFQEHMTQRHNEIDRLQSGRGLRRNIKLGRYKASTPMGHFLENGNTSPFQWTATLSTEWNIWAQVRWKPGEDSNNFIPPRGSDERRKFVKALLLGTSKQNDVYSYARDAWEIMPWSWMVDWFSSAGDFLDANRNQNIAQIDKLWIMLQAVSKWTEQAPAVGKFVSYKVTKIREPGEVSLLAYSPYMTADKAAILAGLAIGDPKHKLPRKFR